VKERKTFAGSARSLVWIVQMNAQSTIMSIAVNAPKYAKNAQPNAATWPPDPAFL
jgi:hypothetical protein